MRAGYGGTENDTWAYYGGGSYYSATLGRPLALKPPLTASGGIDTGLERSAPGAIPGGSGLDVGIHIEQQVEFGAIGLAAGAAVGIAAGGLALAITGGEVGSSFGPIGAAAGFTIGLFIGFFGLFGGGGPSYPAWYIREVNNQGGAIVTWKKYNGDPQGFPLDQNSVAGKVQLAGYFIPFSCLPSSADESPGPGFVKNGRNWWNPNTGQSLSPNLDHPEPQGPHFDLHNRYPTKWKLRIRQCGPEMQFWNEDVEEWQSLEFLPELIP